MPSAYAEVFSQPPRIDLLPLVAALFIVEAGHPRNVDDGLQALPAIPLLKRTQNILGH